MHALSTSSKQDWCTPAAGEGIEEQPPRGRGAKKSRLLTSMLTSLQDQDAKQSFSRRKVNQVFLKQNKIVGREEELLLLGSIYKRVSKAQSEVVLVHGSSGAGKSLLIEAFVGDLPSGVFYVSGKFDQLQSHAPYAALVNASEQLCRQALRRENCNDIRDRLRDLLGPEINLLGSVIPTMAKMTADKKDAGAPSNGKMDGQGFTRFKLLFRAFLRCVASRENPIIIFLDDIQWADDASLEVLKALMSDRLSKHILIVAAYRDGEVANNVLRRYNLSSEGGGTGSRKVDDDSSAGSSMSAHRAQITDLHVSGLSASSLNMLISSVLEVDKSETISLSNLVLNKTDGNAFYILNFLDMLITKNLLSKEEDGSWVWDEEEILRKTDVSDNLATILEAKLRNLPEQVRAILQIASFIGHSFTTEVLVTIVHEEQDMIETEYTFEKHSRELMHDRIIVTLKVALEEGLLETTAEADEYKFSHDRIQHCLYTELMPDEIERGLLHQRIGTHIWHSVKSFGGSSDLDDWVFLAAENFNRALDLVDYSGTRYEVTELNLRAAKLAIGRAAFLSAVEYLRVGLGLLDGDKASWDKHYELCLDVYSTAAEVERNVGCYGRSMELVADIHKRATSFEHHLNAYTIEVKSLAMQGDFEQSIILGLKVLARLDVKFPKKISTACVVKELVLTKFAIGNRSLQSLSKLPEMTDRNQLFALELLDNVAMYAFILGDTHKETYAAVSFRMIRTTIKHGLSAMVSPMAFATWGSIHAVMGKHDVSLEAEKLSLSIVQRFDIKPVKGRVVILNYIMSHLWRNPLDEGCRRELLHAYHLAMSYGDFAYAHHGFISWVLAGMFLDSPLSDIHRRTRGVVAEWKEYEITSWPVFLFPPWQVLLNLTGDPENPDPCTLFGEAFNDDFAMETKTLDSTMANFGLNLCEMMLGYTYENWDQVQKTLPVCEVLLKEVEGFFTTGFNYTWVAVCHYDLYRMNGKRKHKKQGRWAHEKVKKWATTGTVMLSGANAWLNALESWCVKNAPLHEVEIMFEEACAALSENRCRYFEALANEQLARLYSVGESRDKSKGRLHSGRAVDLYRSWGALAKAEWLERRWSTV